METIRELFPFFCIFAPSNKSAIIPYKSNKFLTEKAKKIDKEGR